MGASRTDPCAAFRDRILDLANGEIEPSREPALAVHLEMCGPCRRRLAFDRADRARRAERYAGLAFPAERSEAFWQELSERVERRAAPVAGTFAFRAAASLLFAVGIAAGIWAGPRLADRLRGAAEAPRDAVADAPRRKAPGRSGASAHAPAPAPMRTAGLQFSLPPIRLVSSQEGGF